MSTENKDHRTKAELLEEIEQLRWRLEEAEQTIEAIQSGAVDALVVTGPAGEQIYSLTGAEHTYRVIVETMNEAALTVEADGTVLFCNQRFCDLMKVSMQEAIGRSMMVFAARPQQATLRTMLADAQAGAVQRRVTLHASDGTIVPVQFSVSPLLVDSTPSICLVASDLTELEASANSIRVLREHQQALEESEARFRAIFESSQDAVVIVNDEQVCVQANPAAQAIFGLPPEELLGQHVSEFVPDPEDFAAIWQDFQVFGSFRGEMAVIGADGQTRYVETYAVADILPGRHLAVIRDISERRQARIAMEEANGRLEIQTAELESQSEELQLQTAELVVANENLRKSEQQYHRLFEEDLTGDFICTAEGRIVLCNLAFARMFGFSSADEAVCTNFSAFYIDPGDWGLLLDTLREKRKIERHEVWRKRRDGEPIYVVENLVGHFDDRGRLYEIRGYLFDDTERKRAEEALRESEKRYRTLFESIDEGFCIIEVVFDESGKGIDYRYLEVNPAFERHTGLANAKDRTMRELVPTIEDRWPETYGRIAMTGEPERFVDHSDVMGRWFEVDAFRVGNPREHKVALLFNDITDRKRIEDALRWSEQRFRKLFEADLIGVYVTKADGTILDCNERMVKLLGYDSREEMLQHRSTDFYVDPAFREEAVRILQRDGIFPGQEGLVRRKDGGIVHALGFAVLLKNEQTGEPYIQGVAVDITDRRRAEEALRELNTTLERKVAQRTEQLQHRARQLQKLALEVSEAEDRERRRLAEVLHDDLQQILAAAKFHLSLLKHRVKHDSSLQAVAEQVDGMIKDAIDKSRSLSHELSPAVLHHADFGETLRWLSHQIQIKHGLLVHVDAFSKVDLESEATRAFLYKAAQEMLFNVVKHARVDEARIRVRRLGRCISLSVSDQGRGFDPHELKAATGFGLFSIRERIELLGGRMRIRSAKGKGSMFQIVVPDGPTDGRAVSDLRFRDGNVAEVGDGEAQGKRPRLHVLVADDHQIVREGLTSLLNEEPDIEVVGEAANGREAVNLASQLKPDVVIMDVAMPLINGDEATRQIKMQLPETRVVALSMYDEIDLMERMHLAGAESFVLKTAPSQELLSAIRGQSPDPAA